MMNGKFRFAESACASLQGFEWLGFLSYPSHFLVNIMNTGCSGIIAQPSPQLKGVCKGIHSALYGDYDSRLHELVSVSFDQA